MTYFKYSILFYFVFSSALYADEDKTKQITTASLRSVLQEKHYRVSATVKALNQAKIAAQINAPIKKINILIGDKVKKGKVLIHLNCLDIKLANAVQKSLLQQQNVQLIYAKKQYDRAKKLVARKSLSIEKKEQSESAWQTAKAMQAVQQARLKQSQANISKCTIKAPFAGIISNKMSSNGEYITVGQPLLSLIGNDLEISAMLNDAEIESIQQTKNIQFQAGAKKYKVVIRQLVDILDPITHNQEIRLVFINEKPLSGTFGQLIWQSKKQYLPVQYIVRRAGQLGYFKLNQAQTKAIFKAQSIAIEGVPLKIKQYFSDNLVIEGLNNLQSGDLIHLK